MTDVLTTAGPLQIWWHAYLPSVMLCIFHVSLTLLEFGGSDITSSIYWHHRFPEGLYPLLTGHSPSRPRTGLWLRRLREAPFAFQCLGALVVNMSPHTLLGMLVLYVAGARAHLPPPLLASTLIFYEGLWLLLLSGQMARVIPLQWSSSGPRRWVLRTCMDLTPLLVLLLACGCVSGNRVLKDTVTCVQTYKSFGHSDTFPYESLAIA